jgi:hypothetical protein
MAYRTRTKTLTKFFLSTNFILSTKCCQIYMIFNQTSSRTICLVPDLYDFHLHIVLELYVCSYHIDLELNGLSNHIVLDLYTRSI